MRYRYHWGNCPERERLKGRICKILGRLKFSSVLVRFEDTGQVECISFRALRKSSKKGE